MPIRRYIDFVASALAKMNLHASRGSFDANKAAKSRDRETGRPTGVHQLRLRL
jgi:exoribonuclease R